MGERLQFAQERAEDGLPGTTRLLAVLVALAVGAAGWAAWPHAPLVGVPIEVRGGVPRPGRYLVVDPTVGRAVAAAGGTYAGPDRPLVAGDRVQVDADHPDRVAILPASDPVLVGLPIDPNTADPDALLAVPGLTRPVADAIVAGRPYRTLDDLERVVGVAGLGIEAFVALPRGGPPDVNRATAAELERVDGIGPALAERIVADRVARGPFGSIEDLGRVTGIGPATVDRVRDRVTAGPPP